MFVELLASLDTKCPIMYQHILINNRNRMLIKFALMQLGPFELNILAQVIFGHSLITIIDILNLF